MWGSDAALLQSTEFAQSALFAVEVALAALLQHWGVLPDVVTGHSVGEITAAYVAGVLTLEDAAKVVAARGRLMAALPPGGAMIAVAASEDEVAPLLTELSADVSIAAVNGPNAVVISGADAPVTELADRLAQQGRRVHRLAVSHAFHSVLMDPMLEEFSQLLAGVSAAATADWVGVQPDRQVGGAGIWIATVLGRPRTAAGPLRRRRARRRVVGRRRLRRGGS